MSSFIIEHPTRGTLRPDSVPGNGEWHWSWSGSRDDAEKAWQFTGLNQAILVFEQLPATTRQKAAVLTYMDPAPGMRFADYVKVYPEEDK